MYIFAPGLKLQADMQRHGIQGVPLKRTADQISRTVVQEPEVAVTARQQVDKASFSLSATVHSPTSLLLAWRQLKNF